LKGYVEFVLQFAPYIIPFAAVLVSSAIIFLIQKYFHEKRQKDQREQENKRRKEQAKILQDLRDLAQRAVGWTKARIRPGYLEHVSVERTSWNQTKARLDDRLRREVEAIEKGVVNVLHGNPGTEIKHYEDMIERLGEMINRENSDSKESGPSFDPNHR